MKLPLAVMDKERWRRRQMGNSTVPHGPRAIAVHVLRLFAAATAHRRRVQCASCEIEESQLRNAFDALSHLHSVQQDRQRRLMVQRSEVAAACARAAAEGQALAWKLVQLGGRVGQLTARALAKVKERIRVVDQVAKIKNELKQ